MDSIRQTQRLLGAYIERAIAVRLDPVEKEIMPADDCSRDDTPEDACASAQPVDHHL